ncbi:MAG: effector binding domain-containing protein [Clostridia bacterium]|nr:effector binding domain-containing protein [Clostridia bacterium]
MLRDEDVRIVSLPAADVASIQFYCDEPEKSCIEVMDEFVKNSNLGVIDPGLRHYGFNNPNPSSDTPEGEPDHGYEIWVTIPDDFKVPEPLERKRFDGGLYAAHTIKMGDFHIWGWLWEWVQASDKYEYESREPHPMGGCLEEHMDYLKNLNDPGFKEEELMLDLLVPVKRK